MNTKELAKALQGIIEGKFEIKTNDKKSLIKIKKGT